MPARFRIYDDGGKGGADRYFLVDSKPVPIAREQQHYYGPYVFHGISFNSIPFHPSYGIGLTVELNAKDWHACANIRFRNWGKRIAGNDLPPDGQKLVLQFMKDSEATEAQIHTAMTKYQKEEPCPTTRSTPS